MTECMNDEMRDSLPLLAHGALGEAESRRIRAHVEGCAPCRAELAMLGRAARAIDQSVPAIDLAAVTAGVRRGTMLRIERPARSRWVPRRVAAVAASLLIVATASLGVLSRLDGPTMTTGSSGTSLDTASGGRVIAAAGLAVPGGLADLSDDDLVTLLAELERVEATVEAEPASMRHAVVDVPEGL